jgi:hypothetical protein
MRTLARIRPSSSRSSSCQKDHCKPLDHPLTRAHALADVVDGEAVHPGAAIERLLAKGNFQQFPPTFRDRKSNALAYQFFDFDHHLAAPARHPFAAIEAPIYLGGPVPIIAPFLKIRRFGSAGTPAKRPRRRRGPRRSSRPCRWCIRVDGYRDRTRSSTANEAFRWGCRRARKSYRRGRRRNRSATSLVWHQGWRRVSSGMALFKRRHKG